MIGIMVVAAFAVALALMAGAFAHKLFLRRGDACPEGLLELAYAYLPGAVGLALAAAAGAMWLAPAARPWAWIPAALSMCASVSGLAVLAVQAAAAQWAEHLDRWRR